jgi:hypothetical protein
VLSCAVGAPVIMGSDHRGIGMPGNRRPEGAGQMGLFQPVASDSMCWRLLDELDGVPVT